MTQIRNLFDAGKDIQRTIEKVITYQASQEQRLKAEISEYIATESIEQQLEQLLEKMQAAMEAGSSHEVGVWVSGFYGSGKSSFTKYLGLALDKGITLGGEPFLKHLQNRLVQPTTKALLSKVAGEYAPAVVLLDLAMPEKSGLDVLHELKSSKPTRDIPVIVVSAYAMLMMGSDARRADGVIQKPFDLADLLLQVEQAAAKRRQAAK